ncbi:MAG: hypothetical protein KJ615_06290, partial [Bacteroidetes bacterium]|nr:hypothetical protein [Bacteroidota bacterium]
FRNKGPQKRQYSWEIEEEEELEEKQAEAEAETGQMGDKQERPYWDIPQPDKNDLTVEYHFRKKKH